MNKCRIAALVCIFCAVVLIILSAALPLYGGGAKVKQYNGKDDVIAGSDGFLFDASALPGFCGEDLYTEDLLKRHVEALEELADGLYGLCGCRSIFVTVPSKISVYRDRLPSELQKKYSETRRYTQLSAALEGAGLDVIDAGPYFYGHGNTEQLYHTASDQLNDVGGMNVYGMVADHLDEKYGEKIVLPDTSDYELEITYDASYPLCREYRNATGEEIPNRTVALKEKSVGYTDAGYDYEATSATSDGTDGITVCVYDTGASVSCRKFFSANVSLCVFRRGIVVDDAVAERAKPAYAVFILNEDELDALPVKAAEIEVGGDVSASPVIAETAYSDEMHFVIFGTAEKNSVIKVKGGETDTELYTESGRFVAEVQIRTEPKETTLNVTSTASGKRESEPVPLDVRYSQRNSDKGVVIGKDGHLHYAETVPDFTGETLLDGYTLEQYVNYLNAKADRIHAVSPQTKIIYVIPPNHLTIYPETAPDSLAARKSDDTRLSQFIKAFEGSDKIAFLDLRTALTEAKKTAPYRLYNKTDTHWNELGAYYACKEILEYVAKDYPGSAPDPLESFDVFTKTVPGGDMAKFLGADLNSVTEEGVYVRAANGLKSGISKDYSMNFENAWFSDYHEFEIRDESLPTMIMYRDSFSTNMMSFLSEKFSKSVFYNMWEYPDQTDLYGEMKPDYIIFEFVERSLGGLS